MRKETIWFLSVLILCTLTMHYVFFWFSDTQTHDYPFGKTPDNYFHYTQVILRDYHIGAKYFGTHLPLYLATSIMEPIVAFNLIIPFWFCFLLPLGVYFMSREFLNSNSLGILAAILFTFGTDVIATIFQIAVWPQGFNMILVCFALGFSIRYFRFNRKRDLILALSILVWSALAHLQFAMASFAIALVFLVAKRRYMEVYILSLGAAIILFKLRDIYGLRIISTDFYVNPLMLLFSVFLPSLAAGLYGLWKFRKSQNDWSTIIIIAPLYASTFFLFVDPNYRLYMNMLMFLSPFMAYGLMEGLHEAVTLILKVFHGKGWVWVRQKRFTQALLGLYLIAMFAYFLMFPVYLSWNAIMAQSHGSESMVEKMDKYYPPPTLKPLLEKKKVDEANDEINVFCVKCNNICNGQKNDSKLG